jgi:undecaprenyl pyrophosphate synthase
MTTADGAVARHLAIIADGNGRWADFSRDALSECFAEFCARGRRSNGF